MNESKDAQGRVSCFQDICRVCNISYTDKTQIILLGTLNCCIFLVLKYVMVLGYTVFYAYYKFMFGNLSPF